MKINILKTALFLLYSMLASEGQCQSPNDALMMKAKQACILADYNYTSFNRYWEGSLNRENQTIARVMRSTVLPMAAIGISDRLNFFIGLPHISTSSSNPNGGKFKEVSGFQDLSLSLKYNWLNKTIGSSELLGLATFGFATPASNYLSDYMPYSLGLGAPELTYRVIMQYKLKNGLYVRGAGSYLWRGYTKIEREYYYNNGSYYTPWMDVPNAINVEGIVGKWLWNNSLQIEANLLSSQSLSGDDIRAYNAPVPTNKVNMNRIGIFAHYFFPKLKGLGLIAYHQGVISGRNTAQANTTGMGITYYFNYLKSSQVNEN